MRLNSLIEEIRQLRDTPTHTSTLTIYHILENNKALFLQKLDASDLEPIIRKFERLSEALPRDFGSESYKRDYEQACSTLRFYLDRIL